MLSWSVLFGASQFAPRFEHFTVDEGLPGQKAKVRAQDDQGFLWISSRGLTKYDGYTFKTFLHDPNDPTSISSNDITNTYNSILYSNYKDQHILWICTADALNRFDLETEQFSRFNLKAENRDKSSHYWFYTCYEDRADNLWVKVTNRGLFAFNREQETFQHYLPGSGVRWFYEDPGDTLWVCTFSSKFLYFDGRTNSFLAGENDDPGRCKLCESGAGGILEDSRGLLWGYSQKGLLKYNPQTDSTAHYQHDPDDAGSLPTNNVYGLFEDKQGLFWILCEHDGLVSFKPDADHFDKHTYDPANATGISSNALWGIFRDRSDIIWINSDRGLNKWNRQKEQFKLIQPNSQIANSLNSGEITSIYRHSSGTIWIGTSNGLNRYDPETKTFHLYQSSMHDFESLSNDYIVSICEDKSGSLWVANLRFIHKLDPKTGEVIFRNQFPPPPSNATDPSIQCIRAGRNGEIWLGARWKLHKIDARSGQYLASYLPDGTAIRTIYEDSKGILWIGSWRNGIFLFDPQSESWTIPLFSRHGASSLGSNQINAIYEDNRGVYWIGTNAGLIKLSLIDEDQNLFQCSVFGVKAGINNDDIQSILEDKNGFLWVSTSNGLSNFDPGTETFRNYDKHDGLAGNGFSRNAAFSNPNDELFFGGNNGITFFHPDSLINNPHIPPIVLTDFQLFNESVRIDSSWDDVEKGDYALQKQVSRLDEIQLSYRENVFSFEFAALDYRNPMKNQYAYKMEGFNEDWIYTDASQRIATYTNLDPGEYTFKVKGSNNDDVWNEVGTSLRIIITPPWWRTKTAYFGYFILLICSLSIFYRIRLARVRLQYQAEMDHQEAERYHEIDELKSRFFANISHEFRTPLTLILGPVGKMLTKLKGSEYDQDLNLMQRQAKRLLELVTQLLDLSKLEAGKMKIQASQRNIVPLLKGLTLSFASLAERDEITLSFNTELGDIQVFVEKDALAKIINNLLSNAFKFTEPGGKIQVNVTTTGYTDPSSEGEICIAITDSGIGIPAEHLDQIFDRFYQVDNGETREREGTGIGLALTHEMVELHKGSLGVTSELEVGTTFTICLPLGKNHLSQDEIIESDDASSGEYPTDQTPVEETISTPIPVLGNDFQPILLIVEDNADVRTYIRSFLDELYECHEAVDGEDGLVLALEFIPDMIISDVMMPKMDGVEFCKRIKTDERTSHIPVILLTAKADLESKLAGLETGADDYLTKPFEADELLMRIRNLIAQRQLLKEQFQRELSLVPAGLNLSSMDEQFLQKTIKVIGDHLDDFEFSVDLLSEKVFMSRQHLNRKLKAISGRTAIDFIRLIRLKSAALRLQKHQASISEIAFDVGFSSPSHFAKAFQEEFGSTPSDYLAEQKSRS
ncbi:MAG: response regulator [Candidatus Marinimicrobia bacterium]|nr:response regulator [Candidatus Neomarinimicrobiota bacterium]